MIEQLPSLTPNPDRHARTLARCHAMLDRRRADANATARYAIERNALLLFGAFYLSALALNAMRVLAIR